MNEATKTRELITVTAGGVCLRGTYHRSREERPDEQAGSSNRIGILFLNHGFLPRAAPGDSAVYWAEAFAQCGYPCFRFDLPGLGDSDGDIPAQMIEVINAGGYAPVISAALKELVARFNLSGVVIMGHCAGATTALFTAGQTKECKGLVLTDPYFFLTHERTKIRTELSQWASWSRMGAVISSIYYYLKYIRLLVRRNRPPRNANLALLRCWNQVASTGTPILVMKAPAAKAQGLKPRIGDFDYLAYLQGMSGRGTHILIEFIEGTNHALADAVGRAGVRQRTEQWLNAYFPIAHPVDHSDVASCVGRYGVVDEA